MNLKLLFFRFVGSLLLGLALTFPVSASVDNGAPPSTPLQSFEKKDYAAAEKDWILSLERNPNDANLLYNLATVSLYQKKWGLSLAYLRQLQIYFAQNFDLHPFFDYIRQETKSSDVKQSLEPSNTIEPFVFSRLILPEFLFLHLTYSFFILLLLTKIFRTRRKQRLVQMETTPITIPQWSFLLLWVILTLQLVIQILWFLPQRGTLINSEPISVHSAPIEDSPSVGTLFEGALITAKDYSGEWVQIEHKDSNTGWVKKSMLLLHTAEGLR